MPSPVRSAPLASQGIDGWTWAAAVAVGWLGFNILALSYAGLHGMWLTDLGGRPLARDFACLWGAGRLAIEGHAASAYRWPALHALLAQANPGAFSRAAFPFFYPPFFLFLLAPLGALPCTAAAAVWLAATSMAWLGTARLINPRLGPLLVAAGAPAVMYPIWIGHNGLMSAALLGAGLALLDRRPVLAGVLLGALAYKPQFALLLPVALVASGRWRAAAAAATTVIVLIAASALVFGVGSYGQFVQALAPTSTRFAVLGALPAAKLQSVYGLLIFAGVEPGGARLLQGLISVSVIVAVAWLWRAGPSFDLKAAGLACAVLLVSPYSCVYDLPITVVALLFMVRDRLARPVRRSEAVILALAWTAPILYLIQAFPLGPFVCVLLGLNVVARCRSVKPPATPALADLASPTG